MPTIRKEIERFLTAGFIHIARYAEWMSSIVLVIKNNGHVRICIDFRNLNFVTPRDEDVMPIDDKLIDATINKIRDRIFLPVFRHFRK